MRKMMFFCLGALLLLSAPRAGALSPDDLPAVGYHPGGVAYWDSPCYAHAFAAGQWLEYTNGQWGSTVTLEGDPQFNADGYPQYLDPGLNLRGILFGLHVNPGVSRPPTWPRRSGLVEGRVVLAWTGEADVRLPGGTFDASASSGPANGLLVDGRRVYQFTGGAHLQTFEIHAINPTQGLTDLKVWMPDPANPSGASLENHLFHPVLLQRLADRDWGVVRFMALLDTNGNPQRDWSDRRRPSHALMNGVLNTRAPATGARGNRGSGIPFEHMTALCNAAGKDLWVCVPHLATDDFVRQLAQLIRYGSDGNSPYTNTVADPVHAPLDPARNVYVEYSNEIWSNGDAFPQGDWAQEQATTTGITKASFNARRFCEVWRTFQEVFGGTDRLVRVAAVFTASESYTAPFLAEMRTYGPTLIPPVEPDVVAGTTYFGNGIQDWAHEQAQAAADDADPWFYTTNQFDAGGGAMRPESRPASDPYWTGTVVEAHLQLTFDEWKRRLLAGSAAEGSGPDAVGLTGGFDLWLRMLVQTNFAAPKPLIAYEGGPSLYTDGYDGSDARDDGLTMFMEALNRRAGMADVYRIHLNQAMAKGLRSHMAFTDTSAWGKFGQWGHLEHLGQDPTQAVKYAFMLDWFDSQQAIRHIDAPSNQVPAFTTDTALPIAVAGAPYTVDLETSGGDGARQAVAQGTALEPGWTLSQPAPDTLRISGIPPDSGLSYLLARVTDSDGDPAWRTFVLQTVGGPGTLLECDFRGADPGLHVAWTATHVRAGAIAFNGWTNGPGARTTSGDDALYWWLNMPAAETGATLTLALAEDEYLSCTLAPPPGAQLDLRGREVRLAVQRFDYHAPRQFAFFTSIEGFAESSAIFVSSRDSSSDRLEFSFQLPGTEAYGNLAGPVELRLYGFSGQYGGHRAALLDFAMAGTVAGPPLEAARDGAGTRLRFEAPTPAPYELRASTNLRDWWTLRHLPTATGSVEVVDDESPDPHRFYAIAPE